MVHGKYWPFLGVVLLCVLHGCKKEERKTEAVANVEQAPQKPKAGQGQPCESNNDCAERLGCAPNKTCQTFPTVDCMGRVETCKKEGRCMGSDKGCVAGSDADCASSDICKSFGRCSMQDGKCVAKSAEDCKTLCAEQGRCSIVDGRCAAASDKDCKEVCKTMKLCMAKQGLCMKRPPSAEE